MKGILQKNSPALVVRTLAIIGVLAIGTATVHGGDEVARKDEAG